MSDDGERIEALTEEILPALIARLRASRLGEIEVASDGWRVRLRSDPRVATPVRHGGEAAGSESEAEQTVSAARSPGVGYFSPTPDLAVGRSVQTGDLLGVVDVLGVSRDVTAPEDGIIGRVLAESGQAVEYGQVLAEVDPLEQGLADDLDLDDAETPATPADLPPTVDG